jgi:hypothetical protein
MKPDIKNIGILMAEGKRDEVRAILQEVVNTPLSDIERGEALVTLAMLYVQVKNSIDADFLADLQKTLEALKMVNKKEQQVGDAIALEKVRKDLSA